MLQINRRRLALLGRISMAALTAWTPLMTVLPQAHADAPNGPVGPALGPNDRATRTPIKHVIVIYGENRSFDHLFATYRPRHGQSVRNLLSEKIIAELGNPGPNASKATQYQATDTTTYSIAPTKAGAYEALPPVMTGGAGTTASDTNPPP